MTWASLCASQDFDAYVDERLRVNRMGGPEFDLLVRCPGRTTSVILVIRHELTDDCLMWTAATSVPPPW